jgi:hypothetical protein
MRFDLARLPACGHRDKATSSSRLARALALLLALAPLPALAAGMPESGTKNFTPSPATPSYFSDERGASDIAPQSPPSAVAAPASRPASRPTQATSPASRTAKVLAVRSARPRRLRTVRLSHARARHKQRARR